MLYESQYGVPRFNESVFSVKAHDYALLIPVINEGERLRQELQRAQAAKVDECADIVILDGGSTDGSADKALLMHLGVNTLLVKQDKGKQGAQLRMGFWWALFGSGRGYDGIITIDGNNKDSIEDVPSFIAALKEGYGFVQGSRFVKGGKAVNTPLARLFAVRLLHAPVLSLASGFHYTDTTNAFRAYSAAYLKDERVAPLRPVFSSYEMLAYLTVRAPQLGYKTCEIPVSRSYPAMGKTPTKISTWRGNLELLKTLFCAASGCYNPSKAPNPH